ncbi:MAG: hypothetical protein WBB28_09425 [Crinalium sp.]
MTNTIGKQAELIEDLQSKIRNELNTESLDNQAAERIANLSNALLENTEVLAYFSDNREKIETIFG